MSGARALPSDQPQPLTYTDLVHKAATLYKLTGTEANAAKLQKILDDHQEKKEPKKSVSVAIDILKLHKQLEDDGTLAKHDNFCRFLNILALPGSCVVSQEDGHVPSYFQGIQLKKVDEVVSKSPNSYFRIAGNLMNLTYDFNSSFPDFILAAKQFINPQFKDADLEKRAADVVATRQIPATPAPAKKVEEPVPVVLDTKLRESEAATLNRELTRKVETYDQARHQHVLDFKNQQTLVQEAFEMLKMIEGKYNFAPECTDDFKLLRDKLTAMKEHVNVVLSQNVQPSDGVKLFDGASAVCAVRFTA